VIEALSALPTPHALALFPVTAITDHRDSGLPRLPVGFVFGLIFD